MTEEHYPIGALGSDAIERRLTPRDALERLIAWLVDFVVVMPKDGYPWPFQIEGLDLVLRWDDSRAELAVVDLSGEREPVVIRTRAKLDHVCLCFAMAQARSIRTEPKS